MPRLLVLSLIMPVALLANSLVYAGDCEGWQSGPLTDNGPNGTNGAVRAVCNWDPDGAGPQPEGLVIAGNFTTVEGVPANDIAFRSSVTGDWQALGTGTGVVGEVRALIVYNGDLIAAGNFSIMGGQSVNHIARWNGSGWQPMGSGFQLPQFGDGGVYALAVYDFGLYAAGTFTSAGGQTANNIAVWNGFSWFGVSGGLGVVSSAVYALDVFNNQLVAGGIFTLAGGAPANNIARLSSGGAWQPLANGVNGTVFSLEQFNGEIYAGGNFTLASGLTANYIARWNGFSWAPAGAGCNNIVGSLAVHNNELWVGGYFTSPTYKVAIWSGSSWRGSVGWSDATATVHAMVSHQGDMIAGGEFSSVVFRPANNIARYEGQWRAFGGATVNTVNAFLNFGSHLLVGGRFHQVDQLNEPFDNILRWDGAQYLPLHPNSNPDRHILAMGAVVPPGGVGTYELITSSDFPPYVMRATGPSPEAILQSPQWLQMGNGGTNVQGAVRAIEQFSNQTYIGGDFPGSASPSNPRYIARWTGSWTSAGNMDERVNALKSYGGFLYAGGLFENAGGVIARGLAKYNGTTWSATSTAFSGGVYALEVYNNELIVAGQFQGIPGSPYIAKFNGTVVSNLGSGGANGVVRSLKTIGTRLYAGGEFTVIGGVAANRIAYWDGAAWHAVQGGADSPVIALGAFNNELHAGGSFATVDGGLASRGWAIQHVTGMPWIAEHPSSDVVDCDAQATLTVTPAFGYSNLSYAWLKNGVPLSNGQTPQGSIISGAFAATLTISNITNADAGDYECEVSNECGTTTSGAGTIDVIDICETKECSADIAPPGGNGSVNVQDLLAVIGAWGTCADPDNCPADIAPIGPPVGNDVVNVQDLLAVIGAWGACD